MFADQARATPKGNSINQNPYRTQRHPHRVRRIFHHWDKRITTLFAVSLLLSGVAGCTASPKRPPPSASTSSLSTSSSKSPDPNALADPLSEITDKNDPNYIAASIQPIIHATGSGPSHYDLHLDSGTHSVRVYVVCTQDSPFTVTIGKRFSGHCAAQFAFFADIPVTSANRDVVLTVPDGTRFILVVIPSP